MKRILVGSNGGLTGVYLAKRLSKIEGIELFGADVSEISPGKFFVDKQFFIPRSDSEDFIDQLIDLLNKEKIDYYLPTHSIETKAVAKNEKQIRSLSKTSFVVSPIETFQCLEDKASATINLKGVGIPVPNLICDYNCKYPIFMKKRYGSGSTESAIVESAKIHEAYKEMDDKYAFFELVKGTEYTVDCLFDSDGELIGYNQRKRIKTIGGAVSITENDNSFDILPWIRTISSHWKFCGCVNFQYILRDGTPYFIDINLRYPSGGLPLTVASGIDIPILILRMLDGEKLTPITANNGNSIHRMYRYFEEVFE